MAHAYFASGLSGWLAGATITILSLNAILNASFKEIHPIQSVQLYTVLDVLFLSLSTDHPCTTTEPPFKRSKTPTQTIKRIIEEFPKY